MMLARKWDRICLRVHSDRTDKAGRIIASKDNIFDHIAADEREESLFSDLAGLRQYLLLVEAEMMSRDSVVLQRPPDDRA